MVLVQDLLEKEEFSMQSINLQFFSEKSQGFCPLPWTAQGDERFSAL
jgi:hypothetical protein